MEFERTVQTRINPSLNEEALPILCMPWEEFCQIPFAELNRIFHLDFPVDSNGEFHGILFKELKNLVSKERMDSPLELILKSDGLMIRICSKHVDQFDKAVELAERIFLPKDRITHSLCHACDLAERKRASGVLAKIKKSTRDDIACLSLPMSETPAVEIKKIKD